MEALARASKKYSTATLLIGAKSENRARSVALPPAASMSPSAFGQVGDSSTMGRVGPAEALAFPGVAPSTGELSQFAGQSDDPGGPSRLIRSSERPLY